MILFSVFFQAGTEVKLLTIYVGTLKICYTGTDKIDAIKQSAYKLNNT